MTVLNQAGGLHPQSEGLAPPTPSPLLTLPPPPQSAAAKKKLGENLLEEREWTQLFLLGMWGRGAQMRERGTMCLSHYSGYMPHFQNQLWMTFRVKREKRSNQICFNIYIYLRECLGNLLCVRLFMLLASSRRRRKCHRRKCKSEWLEEGSALLILWETEGGGGQRGKWKCRWTCFMAPFALLLLQLIKMRDLD